MCVRFVSLGALAFRHLSIQLEFRYLLFECTTNRYIHHALRRMIDWVGPAALG